MREIIRSVVQEHGRLAVELDTLDDTSDLYEAGLTSHASVNVMLALEESFDVEFPDEMLQKQTFQSVAAMEQAVSTLVGASR